MLDRAAAATTSLNPFDRLADDESNLDAHEVLPHSHTRTQPTAVLPAAFASTPPGTEQSAQQQLAAIVSGLSEQGAKVKYANVAELNEALDDWAADSLQAGWTATQVESIRAYQRQLICKFAVSERRPLKRALDYHRRWCKAVHNREIDMFARGAELTLAILYDVSNSQQFGGTAAASAKSPHKPKSPDKAAHTGSQYGCHNAGKHPAGSCTNHPASTTHTTAECQKK